MKTSISHIISFICMILISILTIFIVFEISIRDNILIKKLDNSYYYKDAYDNIIYNIDKSIVNEEIKEDYKKIISEELVMNDVKKIITTRNDVSHYSNFYDIISKYSSDTEICDKYATLVNNIYSKSIFPTREYKLIKKLYIRTKNCISYILVLISIIMMLELGLYIINNNFKFNLITLISSSILNMIPFIFINILGIFRYFFYTNSYFTNSLVGIVNFNINILFILGLVVLVMLLIFKTLKRKSRV